MNATQRTIKNILVTGGAGFIGSAFIRYLLSPKRNFKGRCINLDALTYAGNLENLSLISSDPRYLFVKGDIRQGDLIEQIFQDYEIDSIIHFAAESHVDRSIAAPQTFIDTNIMGTFQLLETVRRNPHIHFHHVSTDEVFGMLGENGLFSEDSPYRPNSPYAASKAASDHLVRAYGHTYQLSVCLSNCSNNYGPYQFPEKFMPLLILNSLAKKPLPVYGNGLQVRDWLYVEDHAEALDLLLRHGQKGESYNIGGESEWRNIDVVHEIIRSIAETQGTDLKELEQLITFVADRPGHDFRYAMNHSKIKEQLGWAPSHSFKDGLKKMITWYINNLDWVKLLEEQWDDFFSI
ncbi:MAG: dTDP-glucose 4,6-dehydratase [Chlamydiales bacterium]